MVELECPNSNCDAVLGHEDDIIKDVSEGYNNATYHCDECEAELKKKNVAVITEYDESDL